MKKILFMLAVMLPMLVFTSCSDDDDEINSPVVGTWETDYHSLGIYSILTLNSNGSAVSADYFDDEVYRDKGTYNVSGNTITIDWGNDEQVIMHFTLSNDNNTMTTTMVGESGSTTWERVE